MLTFVFKGQACLADRTDVIQAKTDYVQARQAEVSGQLEGARLGYSRVLSYGLANCSPGDNPGAVKVCGESLGSIGRRAIKLQVALLRNEQSHPSGKYHIKSLENELQLLYRRMQTVEPQNPNWYYLEALMVCEREHHYVKATRLLNKCLSCSGAPTVKAKARKLRDHIKSTADQQQIWLTHDVKIAKENFKRFVESSDFNSAPLWEYSHTDYSSDKNESIPSYERQARNAESRGDHAAAARLRSNSGSISDGSKYNY